MLGVIDRYLEEVLCTISLMAVASSVFLQVVLRFGFNSAASWAQETAVLGMIMAIYFGAALATRERAHIRITALVKLFPRKLQIGCILLADFLWLGFIAFLLAQSIEYSKLLFKYTYILPGLGVEQRWFHLIIPLALSLIMFRMAQVYYRWGKDNWNGLPL